ncbi:phytanoyl-CoA dioxygenase family protein [Tundrisphaera sp. TA3]|uniref:phytanoyl-CoA dioxygenase family protein n=1 Tax=Tundrisphaera sp. TA3 TaxID=3435775 RepID=UPI003EBEC61D
MMETRELMMNPEDNRPVALLHDPGPSHAKIWADLPNDGFVVERGLFAADEVDQVRGQIDALFEDYANLPAGHAYDLDRRGGDGGPGNIPAIRDVLSLRPSLRQTRGMARAIALAGELLGRPAEILWDAAIYKPAGSQSETPWHQDEAVYDLNGQIRKPRSMVYFWIALDPVTELGGTIRFVPGSHIGPLMSHAWRHGDRTSSLELQTPVDPASVACVPLGAGDATIHHPRALHGTGPNNSDRCRKAWVLGIGCPWAPAWLRRINRWRVARRAPKHGG